MILLSAVFLIPFLCKPRASGDDPMEMGLAATSKR